ncbi:uncharacterized protein LOC124912927 [Impatiens glandulifera]|uniref:uncharacterized protein LOC124912927 n=1 Tax=Impatiens glandulifera TaxID=253017 RepID=UPI001FB14348|nr:uncharacterized protein LOC124912927 [Impatiens glandulifera]
MSRNLMITKHRENAVIYSGDSIELKQKSEEFLKRLHLPIGLLPLDNMEELGFNEATSFIWMRQKRSMDHKFKKIGQLVRFDIEITAFVEERRMWAVTGVKGRELMIWIPVNEIHMENRPDPKKIVFCTPTGISKTFPISAFQDDRIHPNE